MYTISYFNYSYYIKENIFSLRKRKLQRNVGKINLISHQFVTIYEVDN